MSPPHEEQLRHLPGDRGKVIQDVIKFLLEAETETDDQKLKEKAFKILDKQLSVRLREVERWRRIQFFWKEEQCNESKI